jgi:metal-responsive CopG/Arc/MetJ family transcriptional regulator
MEVSIMRLAITLPEKLVNEFDKTCKENGYNSRNKGLQDAMKSFIEQNKN